ncbi:PhzF family phenazine biosynthesis isomerase [Streptomyces sp. NPDC048197]|uniref:PhzF family phenazine biosynthesis isomerase n=1 Tax=Streptomyces sp. NPDC048197 TaxID=3365511 RepID=UPI003720A816
MGALLARMMPGEAPPIGLFRMFARNLPMAGAMHGWGRYELSRQLTLTMREREIVIDRTCALCGCEYEWGVHMLTFAERVGLTHEQATSLVHGGPADECWTSEPERLLILAVDMLHERFRRRRRVVGTACLGLRRAPTARPAPAVWVVSRRQLRRPHCSHTARARRTTLRRLPAPHSMTRPTRPLAGHDDLPVTIVHACLREGRGGSPTAVVDETPWRRAGRLLTDGERRLVPTLVGASHAVFLSDDRDPADRRGTRQPVLQVRFFTPETELPACGHGTVAALAFLSARTGDREYRAELWASGRAIKGRAVHRVSSSIDVTFRAGPVHLRQPTGEELSLLLSALGLTATATAGACIATLGRPRLVVPAPTERALAALAPAPDQLAAACDRLGLLGCFVHSPVSASVRTTARMFAPSIGVPEDIANTNSCACLAAHLLARHGTTRIAVDMGDALGSPSSVSTAARHNPQSPLVDVTSTARIARVACLPMPG